MKVRTLRKGNNMSDKLSWDDLKIEYSDEELSRPVIPNSDKEEDDSKSGKGEQGNGTPVPPWVIEEKVRFSNWKYIPEKEIIINIKIQKQVELAKLNSSYIILNFIQSLSLKPELELDNFIIELEKVCFLKYKKSLTDLIESHLKIAILWNKKREEELFMYQKNKILYDSFSQDLTLKHDNKNIKIKKEKK